MQTKKWLDVSGNQIAVYEIGQPDQDIAIIFLHGNSSSTETFERQFSFSLFNSSHLIGFDLPGHGGSRDAVSGKFYSLRFYSEILKRIVNSVDARKLLLVGWSLGGHVILEALNDIESVTAAVIIGTPPISSLGDMAEAFLQEPALGLIQKGIVTESEAEVWAKSCTNLGSSYPCWLKTDFLRTNPNARIEFLKNVANGDFKDEVREMKAAKVPVTIVVGADDPFIKREYLQSKQQSGNVWEKRIEILNGAGHMAHWDAHEAFNHILLERVQYLRRYSMA